MDYEKYAEYFLNDFMKMHQTREMDGLDRCLKGEIRLLINLHLHGGLMQAKEIADEAGISYARVSALLNTEEEKGYIRREISADDRRKVNVILTEAGEAECKKRYMELRSVIAECFKSLGEEDTKNFLRILENIRNFLDDKKGEIKNK